MKSAGIVKLSFALASRMTHLKMYNQHYLIITHVCVVYCTDSVADHSLRTTALGHLAHAHTVTYNIQNSFLIGSN